AHHLLAECFPERVAKARGKPGEFVMANGRGVYVDEHDAPARADYLAVGDLGGGSNRDPILLAAPLTDAEILGLVKDRLARGPVLERINGRFRAFDQTRLGALVLASRPLDKVPAELLLHAEAEEIQSRGLKALSLSDAAHGLRERVAFLRAQDETWPDL